MRGARTRAGALVAAVMLFGSLLDLIAALPAAALPPTVSAIPHPATRDFEGRGAFKLRVRDTTPNGAVTVTAVGLEPGDCAITVNPAATATTDRFGRANFLIAFTGCTSRDIRVTVTDNTTGEQTTILVGVFTLVVDDSLGLALNPTGQGISGSDNRVAGQIEGRGWNPQNPVTLSADAPGCAGGVSFRPTNPLTPDNNGSFVAGFFAVGCQPGSDVNINANQGAPVDLSQAVRYSVLSPGQELPADGQISGDTTSASGSFRLLCAFLSSFPGCMPTSISGVTLTAMGPGTGTATSDAAAAPDYTIGSLPPGTYAVTAMVVTGAGFFSDETATSDCTAGGATPVSATVPAGGNAELDWVCPTGGLFSGFGGSFGGFRPFFGAGVRSISRLSP